MKSELAPTQSKSQVRGDHNCFSETTVTKTFLPRLLSKRPFDMVSLTVDTFDYILCQLAMLLSTHVPVLTIVVLVLYHNIINFASKMLPRLLSWKTEMPTLKIKLFYCKTSVKLKSNPKVLITLKRREY